MTNREWLMNKIQSMSDEEFAEVMSEPNRRISPLLGCNKQEDCSSVACECCIKLWLKAEHKEKPKLSEAERVILENVGEDYKWICRDEDGVLAVFSHEPVKMLEENGFWCRVHGEFGNIECFNHLFQFIKWEDTEAYNVEELLK